MNTTQNTQSELNETATADEVILSKPTADEIAERAYSHFGAGGMQHGNHHEHWLAAEADLLAERNI